MVNEDKKYVVLGDNGQVLTRYKSELTEFLENEKPMRNVFSSEEIKKFENMKTYELVPVDFKDKE